MPSDADILADVVVPDASAIVHLISSRGIIGEDIARRLASATLIAPHLLPIEVDSALRSLRLRSRLTDAEASAARLALAALPIELWPWSSLGDRAWELGQNLSTYDAGYVALAELTGGVLVTTDARIGRAPGVHCAVQVFLAESP